jgi:hypothetical protein
VVTEIGSGEIVRGTAMGMVDNVTKNWEGEQLNDDITMRGKQEVEQGMAALRGSRSGAGQGVGGYGAAAADTSSNVHPEAASANGAQRYSEKFQQPRTQDGDNQYREQEKSQTRWGATEYPSRPEKGFDGSRVPQTEQSQAPPFPTPQHTTQISSPQDDAPMHHYDNEG